MTRRFAIIALITTLFISLAIGLVVSGDIVWLSRLEYSDISMNQAKWAILKEIFFITSVVMILVINLILSYSKNLKLLFENETNVLEQVSTGDLSHYVPVATNDEFGVIAGHTNNMIKGLRHRLQLMTSLRLAEEVSQNLLPKTTPDIEGLDIAGRSIYCDETGGDYYDYLYEKESASGTVGIVVGDVSGHGVESALLMTTVRAFIRQRSSMTGDISEIVTDVNHELTRDVGDSGYFITLFYSLLDPKKNILQWVRAGHDPGVVYNPETDSFSELEGKGLPLGISAHSLYEQYTHHLKKGNVIFLGTDGIRETRNPDGEIFGMENIRRIIRENHMIPANDIVKKIIDEITEFRASGRQEDDITLVVVKIKK